MILTFDLEDDEVDDFNLYAVIENLWMHRELFTEYNNMKDFKKNYKNHITVLDGDNYVCVVDTEEEHFEIINIAIDIKVSGLKDV